MIELVYTSLACSPLSQSQLLALLAVSRRNNKSLNISGLLLYSDKGVFIQVLEGKEQAVDAMYEKIKQSPFHSKVVKIHRHPIRERTFAGWHMGFRNISDEQVSSLEGFTDYMQNAEASVFASNSQKYSHRLLKLFRDGSTENQG